jgi:prepilin-type N-terminal cleavage/methylation domain-containing protein
LGGLVDFSGRTYQEVVLDRQRMGGLAMKSATQNPQSGMSMIEVMVATLILSISSLGVIALVWTAILTNNRNKVDSTQTMLAESIIEQINATIIGSESSALSDCDGTTWTISTTPGGAALSNARIDFTEADPPDDYFMTYVLRAPCTSTGELQASYDVRWNVAIVGQDEGTPTNTYLVTVGAKRQGSSDAGIGTSFPISMRVMVGN